MSSSATHESQLQAALTHLHATLPITSTPYEAALLTTITLLTQELTMVQELVRQQEQTIDYLLPLMRQPLPLQRRSAHTTPPPPSPPKTIRSLEYWLAHVPEYGEALTAEELAAFQSKPRVRPEDIELTAADLARQQRRHSSPTATWDWTTVLVLVIGLLGMLVVLGLWLRSTMALL